MAETVKLAVIGVMGKGQSHARAVGALQGCTLAAVVDHNPDAARVAAELGTAFFTDIQSMIAARCADAVICAVPHPVHRLVEVPCFEAGLHVLSEKPLAATISDARTIVDAASASGKLLGLMYQYHQKPAVRKTRELLAGGAIGDWYYGIMHYGVNRSQAYYDARTWRGTWAGEGGGVVVNQAPHPIEAMCYFAGEFPQRVIALNAKLRHRMQTEDLSTAVLEYAGGRQIMMHADTIQLPISETFSFHGDRGTLCLAGPDITLQRITPDLVTATNIAPGTTKPAVVETLVEKITPDGHDHRHAGMIQDFVDAIREKRQPLVGGEWAVKCVELQSAIIMSAATGKAVNFPPDAAEYDALLEQLKQTPG